MKKHDDRVLDEMLSEIKTRKHFAAAVRVFSYLRRRFECEEFDFVPTRTLKDVARVKTEKEWSGVLSVTKDMLELWDLDLTNSWGVGYAIAHKPEQTLREIIKSILRGFGHHGSAERRREVFAEKLKGLSAAASAVMGKVEAILAITTAMNGSSRNQLESALDELEALQGVEDEVSSLQGRLLEAPEDPKQTIRIILQDIKGRVGDED